MLTRILFVVVMLTFFVVGFVPAAIGFLLRMMYAGFVLGMRVFDDTLELGR